MGLQDEREWYGALHELNRPCHALLGAMPTLVVGMHVKTKDMPTTSVGLAPTISNVVSYQEPK